uniref:Uncharacterized protein n=1 Tax=Panagrolaimus sp. ES5 TaxID=591445 RepID=A0AC34G3X4_9BILA
DDRQFLSDENDIEYYIGPKTASKAAKNLKPCEFRIYYQIPEKSPKVSYKLPLFLAYMSSQNKKVFHFPIVCGKNNRSGENMWSLRYADSATFPSLLALIKYHKTYAYMDPKTGKIDTFPVWKDVIIDEDSFCEN